VAGDEVRFRVSPVQGDVLATRNVILMSKAPSGREELHHVLKFVKLANDYPGIQLSSRAGPKGT